MQLLLIAVSSFVARAFRWLLRFAVARWVLLAMLLLCDLFLASALMVAFGYGPDEPLYGAAFITGLLIVAVSFGIYRIVRVIRGRPDVAPVDDIARDQLVEIYAAPRVQSILDDHRPLPYLRYIAIATVVIVVLSAVGSVINKTLGAAVLVVPLGAVMVIAIAARLLGAAGMDPHSLRYRSRRRPLQRR